MDELVMLERELGIGSEEGTPDLDELALRLQSVRTEWPWKEDVHQFQGDERDLMIFSPVVSKDMPAGELGFLRGNGNLFNVAITRARAQLVVVGDLAECSQCDVDYLSNFAVYTQKLNEEEQKVLEKRYGDDLGRSYPVVTNPEQVSDWERILYSALYDAGIKTLPQYRIEKYALDLALINGKRRLDIEVDGEKYHRNWTGELCRRDQIRNQRLYELGWDVMRFWVYEIRDDMPGCIKRVRKWLEEN
ncbi:MAG: AAA domain-containing protein [Alphaproteobacteria bacterium]